jgi:hypothetical protein
MGTTVSGRSGEFPNLHLLSGMYMNVQPIRVQLSGNKPFPEWFTQIQAQQQEARKYEHMSLDEITETIKWPSGRLLSDSLLIFENYAVAYPTDGQLRVTEMRSGLTSNFPVTLVIIPGDQISFSLSFFPDVVNRHISEWLLAGLKIILNELVVENRRDYNAVRLKLEIPPRPKEISEKSVADKSLDTYLAPTNEIELKLVQIWESVFGTSPIGVNDNFFALGGKSLMAVKLFTIINQQLDWKF